MFIYPACIASRSAPLQMNRGTNQSYLGISRSTRSFFIPGRHRPSPIRSPVAYAAIVPWEIDDIEFQFGRTIISINNIKSTVCPQTDALPVITSFRALVARIAVRFSLANFLRCKINSGYPFITVVSNLFCPMHPFCHVSQYHSPYKIVRLKQMHCKHASHGTLCYDSSYYSRLLCRSSPLGYYVLPV